MYISFRIILQFVFMHHYLWTQSTKFLADQFLMSKPTSLRQSNKENLPKPTPVKTPTKVITSITFFTRNFLKPVGSTGADLSSVVLGPLSPGPIFANKYSEKRSLFSITGKIGLCSPDPKTWWWSNATCFQFYRYSNIILILNYKKLAIAVYFLILSKFFFVIDVYFYSWNSLNLFSKYVPCYFLSTARYERVSAID